MDQSAGHVGLPSGCSEAIATLAAIFAALDGDPEAQSAKRTTSLTGDFIDLRTGTLIEVDESQHFTSFRRTSLVLYPAEAPLGFHRDHYLDLCRELAPRSDRYRASNDAAGFGSGGRQRQRAYHDALRDLSETESVISWRTQRPKPVRLATGLCRPRCGSERTQNAPGGLRPCSAFEHERTSTYTPTTNWTWLAGRSSTPLIERNMRARHLNGSSPGRRCLTTSRVGNGEYR